jgi:hypothetical protein
MSFYEWFQEYGGEQFEISRGDKTFIADGINNNGGLIMFSPETDVRVGDWVKSIRLGDRFHVLGVHTQRGVETGGIRCSRATLPTRQKPNTTGA